MNRSLFAVACFALVAGIGDVAAAAAQSSTDRSAAPVFSLRALDGKTFRLSELKGHPVIIDFWATWCGPCRASMPGLNTLQDRYRDRGLVVLGLSVDDGEPQRVRRFAERLGVRFRLAMADERVMDLYGPIRSIPTTFYIDRKGNVIRRVVGYIDDETMDAYVKELF